MNYKELENHASSCQMAADEMAVNLIRQQTAMIVQSVCDFNIFMLYNISPEIILRFKTIEFFKDNIKQFKRKLTMKEALKFDSVIHINQINDWKEFIKFIK